MNREKTVLDWKKDLANWDPLEVLKKTGVTREEKGIYLSSEDPMMQKFINKTSKLDSQNPKKSYEYDRLAGKQFAVMGLDKF